MKNLTQFKQGDMVKIIKVGGTGAFRKRLLDMGFLKGSVIHIVKFAPLKDPLELVLKDFHISLRIAEAENIIVDKI